MVSGWASNFVSKKEQQLNSKVTESDIMVFMCFYNTVILNNYKMH